MIKRLKGVLELTGLGCASAQAMTLDVPHGGRLSLLVTVASDDGTVADLTGGTVAFRLIRNCSGSPTAYTASALVAAGAEGVVQLDLVPNLPVGAYSWDLWFTPSAGASSRIIPLGAFLVTESSR